MYFRILKRKAGKRFMIVKELILDSVTQSVALQFIAGIDCGTK